MIRVGRTEGPHRVQYVLCCQCERRINLHKEMSFHRLSRFIRKLMLVGMEHVLFTLLSVLRRCEARDEWPHFAPPALCTGLALMHVLAWAIQRQVQREHVNIGLAEDTQEAP